MSVAQDARVELHDSLALTGAEVSINHLPAGAGVPFVHSQKQNEEIYGILSGKGFIPTVAHVSEPYSVKYLKRLCHHDSSSWTQPFILPVLSTIFYCTTPSVMV